MNPFMKEALKEAKKAASLGEVPVGAVLVKDGAVQFRSHNKSEVENSPLAHAEYLLIRDTLKATGAKYLTGYSLYVTLEPCPMCAGAILLSRPDRVYFGAYDPTMGACGGKTDLLSGSPIEVYGGIMEEECSSLLKSFFKEIRNV